MNVLTTMQVDTFLKRVIIITEEKEYNIQLGVINNKFKKTVPVYSDLEISFAENEMHKKIAESNTNSYKKCNLSFLVWSIGTSIVGLVVLILLACWNEAVGERFLTAFVFLSLIEIKKLNKKHVNRRYYSDWSAKNGK